MVLGEIFEKILGLADGADGNRDWRGRRIRRSEHVAATIKNSAGVDDHAGRVDFTRNDTLGLDFHAAFCEDDPIKAAGDDYVIPFDLAFDFSAFAEDYRLFGDNVSLHVAIDAERAFDLQRSFHGDALIDESCPVLACAVFRSARPSPRHLKFPPELFSHTLAGCGAKSTQQNELVAEWLQFARAGEMKCGAGASKIFSG